MPYNIPVIFTKTNQYGCGPTNEDDVYTVKFTDSPQKWQTSRQ